MTELADLRPEDERAADQVAALLVDFWPNTAAAWPDLTAARDDIEDSFEPDRVSRVALDEAGDVTGWVAAAREYSSAWELHPLVVRRDVQGRGIGRALVTDLEAQVAARGGLTVYLGADDFDQATSLGGRELFPGVLRHAEALSVRHARHPLGFYLRLGYEVVGVIPDANGAGRPDIWCAKRVARPVVSVEPDEVPE